jgi:hypothetical protein
VNPFDAIRNDIEGALENLGRTRLACEALAGADVNPLTAVATAKLVLAAHDLELQVAALVEALVAAAAHVEVAAR